MSIQAVSVHNTLAPSNTGPVTVLGAKVGDVVVSVQSIGPPSGPHGLGVDMSSFFASTVSTDDEVEQTTTVDGQTLCLFVLARGF
jgi:hypothetical protein